jgi:hypothetical protein
VDTYKLEEGKPMGAVVLTVEGAGETEAAAAESAANALAAQAVPQVLELISRPPKKEGDGGTV